jgi:uncharacterized protein (TIGR02118 family)
MATHFKVDILYPKSENSFFHWDHYLAVHCKLALTATEHFARYTHYDVARPLNEENSPFHCLSTVYFDSKDEVDKFFAGFSTDIFAKAFADQPNYTNVEPQFSVSEHLQWSTSTTRVR